MALMTQKEYAKHRGVSATYINRLVAQDRIALNRAGKIDAAKADRLLGPRTHKPRARAAKRPSSNAHGGGRPPRGSATASLTASRAEKMKWEALTAKQEYERSQGQWLPTAEVRQAEQMKNSKLRTSIRAIARSLADTLARATEPAEVEALMLAEIDRVLTDCAADPLGDAAAAVVSPAGEVLRTFAQPEVTA